MRTVLNRVEVGNRRIIRVEDVESETAVTPRRPAQPAVNDSLETNLIQELPRCDTVQAGKGDGRVGRPAARRAVDESIETLNSKAAL